MTIVFETHATSLDNEAGLAAGQFDAPLSPAGERQARELGARYEGERLDAVFCSDLERSWRTAEIAFAGRGLAILRDPRLREIDYGDWTRQPADQVDAEKPRRLTVPFPKGESYAQACERIQSFLADTLRDYAGRRVLIVGHRATLYGLQHWLEGRPLEELVSAPWRWQPGWRFNRR